MVLGGCRSFLLLVTTCSRVPQVHFVRKQFVRKQTMCKSLYTYLTICERNVKCSANYLFCL